MAYGKEIIFLEHERIVLAHISLISFICGPVTIFHDHFLGHCLADNLSPCRQTNDQGNVPGIIFGLSETLKLYWPMLFFLIYIIGQYVSRVSLDQRLHRSRASRPQAGQVLP